MRLDILPGEKWWGGATNDGTKMPFAPGFSRDLLGDNYTNQSQPLLVSSAGRFVWSEEPFAFAVGDAELTVTPHMGGDNDSLLTVSDGHSDLRGAFRAARDRFFPPDGRLPEPLLFTAPQYNTWIELMYDQNEDAIRAYADALLANGYPPGVLMIDDNWQEDYGVWRFHDGRFRDPKGLIKRLHGQGFQVMLWTCPFVSPDSLTYRKLRNAGLLLRDATGEIAIRRWWNGWSAVLDMTNADACTWYAAELGSLETEFGVDGWKFDAGDFECYRDDDRAFAPGTANAQCEAYFRFVANYPLNELRACWKCAGLPLVQRLADKNHSWTNNGLGSLIPNGLAQGIVGYPFGCPDMIGGGEYLNFMANSDNLDAELVVRYAQCAALFPMMQFSVAPWRILPKAEQRLCVEAAQLHARLGAEILALAESAAKTGEPILRHLAYEYPGRGYEGVNDVYLLGGDILVAPVVVKGDRTKTFPVPPGVWEPGDGMGETLTGPATATVDAPLNRLPWFRRIGTSKAT